MSNKEPKHIRIDVHHHYHDSKTKDFGTRKKDTLISFEDAKHFDSRPRPRIVNEK